METGALVIGGDYRGLGVVRSLGRHGIPVWVLNDEHAIASTSRYARRRLSWPAMDDASQVEFLLELSARNALHGWALFPTTDESAALLARHHSVLSSRWCLTVPPWGQLQWAYDKRLTYQLAEEIGVDFPWTHRSPRYGEDIGHYPFPLILKPAFKQSLNDFTRAKAWRVDRPEELPTAYDAASNLVSSDLIIVQEFIPGGGEAQFSYAALCEQGAPLAWLTARRLRQFPRDFGQASSFVETVDLPQIEEPARRLLMAMRYSGLIEIEFKYDKRDGRFKLLDLNPRVWGWHTLGQRAGVDFSYLFWQLIRGEAIPETRAVSGVRWVRTVTDLPAAAIGLWQRQLSFGSYIRSFFGPLEFAIFAPDDPVPALLDLPLLCHLAWKRKLSRKSP